MSGINDPIADLLTRIRNAVAARHRYVDISSSRTKHSIAKVLKQEGYVAEVLEKAEGKKKTLRIFLKYGHDRKGVIQELKRVSKPSLRKYVSAKQIPHVRRGMGSAILSTSQGILAGHTARENKVGGELLCLVW